MSGEVVERHPREALDLTVRVVALQRGGAGRPAVLAAVDQARTSLLHERDPQVRRSLSRVCRAILDPDTGNSENAMVVDAALQVATKALAPVTDGEA